MENAIIAASSCKSVRGLSYVLECGPFQTPFSHVYNTRNRSKAKPQCRRNRTTIAVWLASLLSKATGCLREQCSRYSFVLPHPNKLPAPEMSSIIGYVSAAGERTFVFVGECEQKAAGFTEYCTRKLRRWVNRKIKRLKESMTTYLVLDQTKNCIQLLFLADGSSSV